jgi:hypothetical protein
MPNVENVESQYEGMIKSQLVSLELVSSSSLLNLNVAVKVYPGEFNKGIFITVREDEEYHLTHPTANVTGFVSLKMHPYVTVQDYCIIRCPKTRMKALLKYNDEVISV